MTNYTIERTQRVLLYIIEILIIFMFVIENKTLFNTAYQLIQNIILQLRPFIIFRLTLTSFLYPLSSRYLHPMMQHSQEHTFRIQWHCPYRVSIKSNMLLLQREVLDKVSLLW